MSKIYNYVVEEPKITSGFGNRTHPITGKKNSFHNGTDLISGSKNKSKNKNLYAVEDGYVQKVVTGKDKATTGFGNYIWVRYPRINRSLLYAHCSKILLKKGDKVKKGTIVAIMGMTGGATGVHVHLGMTEIGKDTWLNPQIYNYVPEKTISVTSVVTRDKTKNQLKVIAENLRVRKSTSTESDVVGMSVKNGIYNYYEIKADNKYTWYRISDNQWIANNGKYLEIYPKKEEVKIDYEKLYNEKVKEVDTLKSDKLVLEEKLKSNDTTISDLEAQINKLKQDNINLQESIKNQNSTIKFEYTAIKKYKYKIKLNKGEKLIILK